MPAGTASSAGISDDVFIHQLREFMEDMPLFTPQQVSPNGVLTEYKLNKFPVYDSDPYLTVTVNGVVQALAPSRTGIAPGAVFVDYENGWMFWGTAPPSGTYNIQIRMSTVRWRSEKMLEALNTGLRMMFPQVWQTITDTSITIVTNQYDYPLPVVFNDPRVSLIGVEFQEYPNSTYRFRPLGTYRRVGNVTLQVPGANSLPPGTNLRLTYAGPYKSLSDLEDQLTPLPIWYAKGYLLSNKEIVRVRYSTSNVTQDEAANPVGSSQNAGQFFFNQFYQALNQLKRPMPHGPAMLATSL